MLANENVPAPPARLLRAAVTALAATAESVVARAPLTAGAWI